MVRIVDANARARAGDPAGKDPSLVVREPQAFRPSRAYVQVEGPGLRSLTLSPIRPPDLSTPLPQFSLSLASLREPQPIDRREAGELVEAPRDDPVGDDDHV